ncbi:DEP domain [Macleaya cordata]|uniref:DEP domain n=1 Tax=Macleaya cordata TaxID=56857 RepID=A0A200QR53_MACCD|nr:DEP domain [Macleaya cordata]
MIEVYDPSVTISELGKKAKGGLEWRSSIVSLTEIPKITELHFVGVEMENKDSIETNVVNSPTDKKIELDTIDHHRDNQNELPSEIESLNIAKENPSLLDGKEREESHDEKDEEGKVESENQEDANQSTEKALEEQQEPVFDGTEIPEMEVIRSSSTRSLDLDPEAQGSAWPEKAVALKNFVKEKSAVAVSSVLRRLSGSKDDDGQNLPDGEEKDDVSGSSFKEEEDLTAGSKSKEVSKKPVDFSAWNPISLIKRDLNIQSKAEQVEDNCEEDSVSRPTMKGRIILYTRLGCQDCKDVRLFLQWKRVRYVEINIDVYPSRKLELEKLTGSSAVPKVFFNELPVGGLGELKSMDECGKLDEKIKELISEEPSSEAPLPPLSGEDDVSCSGTVDELAVIVKKMRESILVKDRFYKMRRFTNCFLGSEAVDFLSEDQYMEREEAIEFARNLASKHFFRHVLDENVFEDGNHLYRFLDHDPIVLSQCHNIPRGKTDVKPKPVIEIASRLRFISFAIFEAYTSEDGKHVDYGSIHGSEEFARYLRVVEELQRVELQDLPREEKLAFFINLYNMMAIHAILLWGYPIGALERRKMLGDFKYVIGGFTYSLSAIQNGILRGNQRPPYNIIKPFGAKDPRSKIALPYPEPLIHFTLVCGTRSGPALRCYSAGDIDKELMEAARNFLRNGGLIYDPATKTASVNKILKWYSIDFGKNEGEVLKHAANYLEPGKLEELLELIANTQLKVTYQPYDWGLNC